MCSETYYMQIGLEFQGYTWDEYFHVIANKPGIVVVYKGGLDSEGAIRLDNIIYVDGADEIGQVYESNIVKDIRKEISNTDRLFFSYAEMKAENRNEVVSTLKSLLKLESGNNNTSKLKITCKGACALFPIEILSE